MSTQGFRQPVVTEMIKSVPAPRDSKMLPFGAHQVPGDLRDGGRVVLGDVLLTNPALLVLPVQDALCAENVCTGQLGWVGDLLLAASAFVHAFSATHHIKEKHTQACLTQRV